MNPFTGTWRIASSPHFDAGELASEGLPYVRLRQQGDRIEGEYEFAGQRGNLDGRPDGTERIIFSFEGMDGEALVNGAGIATVQGDRLLLKMMYHFGPDCALEGIPQTSPPSSPSPSPPAHG